MYQHLDYYNSFISINIILKIFSYLEVVIQENYLY